MILIKRERYLEISYKNQQTKRSKSGAQIRSNRQKAQTRYESKHFL